MPAKTDLVPIMVEYEMTFLCPFDGHRFEFKSGFAPSNLKCPTCRREFVMYLGVYFKP